MLDWKDNHSNKSLYLKGMYGIQDVSYWKCLLGSNGDFGENVLRSPCNYQTACFNGMK